ncbi:MAG: TIGR00730 family Rossman fold protein [Bacteroidales bacterium]
MKKICVFCGSSTGINGVYRDAAVRLGEYLGRNKFELVYGGGNVGLMGILADSAMEAGGKVTGIIPEPIARLEIAHKGITELEVVADMHIRKARMAELADGFIALPGGFGTLDELSEVMTFSQLRIYDKPVGLLNTEGYFNHLIRFLDHSVREGFVRPEHRQNIFVEDEPGKLIEQMKTFRPHHIGKWIDDIKNDAQSGNTDKQTEG